jgi:hypothetical protein
MDPGPQDKLIDDALPSHRSDYWLFIKLQNSESGDHDVCSFASSFHFSSGGIRMNESINQVVQETVRVID